MVCVMVGWLGLVGCGDNKDNGGTNTPTLQSISITPGTASVATGATVQLTAMGALTDGTSQDLTTTVTWSSSSTATATVSSTGVVTGVAVGNATITATSGSTSATATVNVTGAAGNKTVTSIAITPIGPTVVVGGTKQLTATATFSDQSVQDVTSSATWSSDTPASASVSPTGLVSGVAAGTATITAMFEGVSDTTAVTVNVAGPHILISIAISPTNPTLGAGATLQMTAIGTFADGTTEDITGSVIWKSDVADVARISEPGGLITALAAGTSTITATKPVTIPEGGTVVGSTTLLVTAAPPVLQSIAVTPTGQTVAIGNTLQMVATGTFNVGPTQDITGQVTWASDNEAVATVDAKTGLVTAVAAGDANISATKDAITASTKVSVTATVVTAIVITPDTVTLRGTETQQFTAMATFSDGTTKDITATAKWASSNIRSATISNKVGSVGLATAVAVAVTPVDITAAQDGVSAKASLVVQAPSVLSTTPADGAADVNTARISVTFDQAVLLVTTQAADGPCTGSLQLSSDDFTTCVGFAAQPSFLGNVASVGVRNALAPATTYKIRVTTDVISGVTPAIHGQAFTQATGFTTAN